MDERTLIIQAQEGNKTAMELLYRSTIDYIFKFVRSSLQDIDITEDVVSKIYLNAFTNLNKFRNESSFKTWLHIIARNEIYHQYTSNGIARRHLNIDENYLQSSDYIIGQNQKIDDYQSVEEEEEARMIKEDMLENQVEKVLSVLKPRYAEVLKLRFISSFSIKECAEILGVTENNIKVLQNRALKSAGKLFKTNIKDE